MTASSAEATSRSSTVEIAGEHLHVLEAGKGPPVLLVHGLNASTHVFQTVWERAARHHLCLAVDLPCSGKSGDYCEYDPPKLADALAKLLRDRKAAPAVVVGHSYGGVVAMELLARHPEVVRGLVVLSAPALGLGRMGAMFSLPLTEQLWTRTGGVMRSPRLLRAWLRVIRGGPRGIDDALVSRYAEAMAHERHPAITLQALRSLARYHLPVEALRRAKQPKVVLWGDRDRLVPIFQGEQVAHALEVPLTILHEAGHCLPEERPEAVLAAIDGLSRRGAKDTRPRSGTRAGASKAKRVTRRPKARPH